MHTAKSSVRFRPATLDDATHCARLVLDLYHRIGTEAYGIAPDADSIAKAVVQTIQHGICIVSDCACAGGFIVPYIFNQSAKIGHVVFWNYSRPSGIKILPEFALELKQHGATHIFCSSHHPRHTIARYYRRFGLRPCDLSHTCALAEMTTTTHQTTPKD